MALTKHGDGRMLDPNGEERSRRTAAAKMSQQAQADLAKENEEADSGSD